MRGSAEGDGVPEGLGGLEQDVLHGRAEMFTDIELATALGMDDMDKVGGSRRVCQISERWRKGGFSKSSIWAA